MNSAQPARSPDLNLATSFVRSYDRPEWTEKLQSEFGLAHVASNMPRDRHVCQLEAAQQTSLRCNRT